MNHQTDNSLFRKRFDPLEGCAWPDPDPSSFSEEGGLHVNDVSQMSTTPVDRIVFPRTEQDVVDILQQACLQHKHVSIRGTQHSMGGHCMTRDGYVMDTAYLNQIQYNNDDSITVGPGCTWAHVIACLNQHGKSPTVMQSYCSFSVGGTLAVNAHGITSDQTLASCVMSFRLVKYACNGENVEVVTCTRPPKGVSFASLPESQQLFRLVLGGYGLFGVVTSVTMSAVDNVDLEMESLTCLSLQPEEDSDEDCEFVRVWDACRNDTEHVNIKLARLDILSLNTATIHLFRKGHGPTISNLTMQPRQLSSWGRLMYKWALPLLQDVRQSREESSGTSMDMQKSRNHQQVTRNDVLWESALPLAKLYSPLVVVNDTFVLQEYFVPHDAFSKWINAARPIFAEIHAYQRNGSFDEEADRSIAAQSLTLLNTTIRYVEHDELTFLKYSPREGGMFAFVLYFRIKRSAQVERDLGTFHNRLAEKAVAMGGTFYLPYRKCYSQGLMLRAYPQMKEFALLKEKYDPNGTFSSQWFEHYVLPLCSDAYQTTFLNSKQQHDFVPVGVSLSDTHTVVLPSEDDFLKWLPRIDDPLLERRTNSYRTLLNDTFLREQFSQEFLVNVFHIAEPTEVMRVMTKAAWDPRNANDLAIYRIVREHFHESSTSSPIATLQQGWRAVRQISHQKAELGHETAIILHRLGMFGRVRGYLSIGDHGKMVRTFRKIGIMGRSADTNVIVAHNFHPDEDEVSLSTVLERGSMNPVGDEQIQFDYLSDDAVDAFKMVPSESMDLVTLNQGLHHFPQQKLYGFLKEVRRMLRQGGVFIVREHDLRLQATGSVSATNEPVAMLDLAHSVFNAVTGVPEEEEANEIRAFRPISEWRSTFEKMGFVDSLLYGLEKGDCTYDFMLCFTNGPVQTLLKPHLLSPPVLDVNDSNNDEEPAIMAVVRALLAQVPAAVAGAAEDIIRKLLEILPGFIDSLSKFLLVDLPKALTDDERKRQARGLNNTSLFSAEVISEFATLVEGFLRSKLERVTEAGFGAKELLQDVHIRETTNIAGLLTMPELFLVLPLLKRKLTLDPESVGEVEKMILAFVENSYPVLLQIGDSTSAKPVDTNVSLEVSNHRGDPFAEESVAPKRPVDKNDDVLNVIITLGQHIPGLLDPSIVLSESGFSLSQQSALVGSLAANDLSTFAENVAFYHDQQSWQQLRWILVGDPTGALQVDSVLHRGKLPTKELLLSRELNHPWHQALKSFLKGPRVNLKQQVFLGLRMLDLGDLVALYKEAKEETNREQTSVRLDSQAGLSYQESTTLRHLMENLSDTTQVKDIRIQFDGTSSNNYDLFDVAVVVKAEFGYKSLTSSLTNVTNEMQALHAEVHSRTDSPVGWLPIRQDLLTNFRNKGGAAKMGDSLRKVVVGTGSLGLAGNNVLKLIYVPLQTNVSPQEVQVSNQVCTFSERHGLVDADLHPKDGHYTWFKLSEWMQVEIIDLFTKSLEHTPWYQFPFLDYISTYFQTLLQECEIVRSEHGLVEAYASMAFGTDLVPGIFMSLLFLQMQLLSIPLKLSLPSYDSSRMTEEVLMTASLPLSEESMSDYFQRVVDNRIQQVSLLYSSNDGNVTTRLYRITVPTFKTMGEIIINIGDHLPSAKILQISNQTVVQVLLVVTAVNGDDDYLKSLETYIDSLNGVQVMFHYQFPTATNEHYVSVKVQVTSLLLLTRFVARLGTQVRVKQIFDFWAG